ncbi:MAG: hypothetical protein P8X90_36130 [Desulfobacterales bacterium]
MDRRFEKAEPVGQQEAVAGGCRPDEVQGRQDGRQAAEGRG